MGDLVLVHDSNKLRNKYKLAIVTEVHVSLDGMVRSCTVGFRQSRSPTKKIKYRSVWQSLQRSVQRLTLLLPVEEQEEGLQVTDGVVRSALLPGGDVLPPGGDCMPPGGDVSLPGGEEPLTGETSKIATEENGHAANDESGIDSGIVMESILSPTADPFHPREMGDHQEKDDSGKEVLDQKIKVLIDLAPRDDISVTEGSSNAAMKTEEEKLRNDLDEKRSSEVPSTADETGAKISPTNDKIDGQEKRSKRGRPRKGLRVPTRRSIRTLERSTAWRQGRSETSL